MRYQESQSKLYIHHSPREEGHLERRSLFPSHPGPSDSMLDDVYSNEEEICKCDMMAGKGDRLHAWLHGLPVTFSVRPDVLARMAETDTGTKC